MSYAPWFKREAAESRRRWLLFFLCLTGTISSLIGNTLSRPSLLWEVIDDMRSKRLQQLRQLNTHGLQGEQHG